MASPRKRAPGIYEVDPGVFKVVVSLGRGPNGRWRQKARVVHGSLRDAKAERGRLIAGAVDGQVLPHTAVTFGAVLDRWPEHIEGLGRSPTTLVAYRVAVNRHLKPALGSKAVSKLTTLDLDTFSAELARTRKPTTVAKVHLAARGALT